MYIPSPVQSVSRALISLWIPEEVELVILFGIIPRSSLENLRDNPLPLGRKVFGLDLFRDTLCDAGLLGSVCKDGRPVLWAYGVRDSGMVMQSSRRTGTCVCPLSVHRRRIVRTIKKLWMGRHQFQRTTRTRPLRTNEFVIRDDGGIKLDPQRFCMLRRPSTHFPVIRVDRGILAPSVSHRRPQDPLVLRGRVML